MKFVCDDNLGKLAKFLRILGYDVLFDSKVDDHKLIRQSLEQERIILTRDTKLARFKIAQNQILVENNDPIEQLKQVIRHLKLKPKKEDLFFRCLLCNNMLEIIEKKDTKEKIPPYVFKTQEHFVICKNCDKIFWEGTHVKRIKEKLENSNELEGFI